MPKVKMISINYEKFINEINNTNVPFEIIANTIGYASKKYFGNAKKRGVITELSADKLERFYGIRRTAYEVVENPKPHHETKEDCVDYVKLYNTIYQAVLTALQENAKGLHDRLFEVK